LTKALSANHHHCRPGRHIVGRCPAEADDKVARLATRERAELSRKNDKLTGERM
jgi:hypothetical protein